MITEVKNFKTQRPDQVLLEIYRIGERIRLGEKLDMPLITVYLWPEGNTITGFLVDIQSDKNDHHISMRIANNEVTNDIVYFFLGAIRGVAIQHANRYEHILYEVTAEDLKGREISTTKLQVRRALEDSSKGLSTFLNASINFTFDGEIPEDPITLFMINNIITDAEITLKRIATDPMAKEVIAKELKTIRLAKNDQEFEVVKNGQSLLLTGNFTHSFTTTSGRNKLKKMFMEIL